jgi:hypothetical protein
MHDVQPYPVGGLERLMSVAKFPVKGASTDNGSTPPEPPSMDHAERIATLEAIIPTLATKVDLAELRSDMNKGFAEQVKWIVGTSVALGAAGITVMTFVLNNATPKAAPAPTVLVIPAQAVAQPPAPVASKQMP